MIENLIWLLCVCGSGLLFIGIGVYSILRKTPMHFWAGTRVISEQLRDVRKYNFETGIIWVLYGIPFFISGFVYFLWPITATVILFIAGLGGIPLLILNYRRIWKKYCR